MGEKGRDQFPIEISTLQQLLNVPCERGRRFLREFPIVRAESGRYLTSLSHSSSPRSLFAAARRILTPNERFRLYDFVHQQ